MASLKSVCVCVAGVGRGGVILGFQERPPKNSDSGSSSLPYERSLKVTAAICKCIYSAEIYCGKNPEHLHNDCSHSLAIDCFLCW